MNGGAHATIGASVAFLVTTTIGPHVALPLTLAAGAVGGLLPDVDHPNSTLGRRFAWPSVVATDAGTGFVATGRRWFGGRTVWHRNETHSLGAAGIAAALAMALAWWPCHWGLRMIGLNHTHSALALASTLALALLVGYVSHLAADAVNTAPQMLMWPVSRVMLGPVSRGVRVRSAAGRRVEALACVFAVAASLTLWGARYR